MAGEETDLYGIMPGTQIGVEAKLKPNLQVIFQAMPQSLQAPGPHHYVILVPWAPAEYIDLVGRLKIGLIHAAHFEMKRFFKAFRYRHEHVSPCWVPDVEVKGMKAGIRAPLQLTKWKLGSVKLGLLGTERGYLTLHDFKEHDIQIQRWIASGWLEADGKVISNGRKVTKYLIMEDKNPPHLRYHDVAEALKENACTASAATKISARPKRTSSASGPGRS